MNTPLNDGTSLVLTESEKELIRKQRSREEFRVYHALWPVCLGGFLIWFFWGSLVAMIELERVQPTELVSGLQIVRARNFHQIWVGLFLIVYGLSRFRDPVRKLLVKVTAKENVEESPYA